MAVFVNDTFTDTAGTTLTSHVGETGATWVEHPSFATGEAVISDANRLRSNSANAVIGLASGTPGSADYTVTATLVVVTGVNRAGLVARFNATNPASGYLLWHRNFQGWQLFRYVSSTATQVGSTVTPATLTAGTYTLSMQVAGTGATVTLTCKLQRVSDSNWLNSSGTFQAGDTAFITFSDTDAARITAVGQAGVTFQGADSNTTGLHLDSLQADDAAGGGGTTLTPTTLALSTATFAPTVAATSSQTVTPTTLALALTTFAPTVTAGGSQAVTPDALALALTTFAPTVSATSSGGGGYNPFRSPLIQGIL